MLRDQTQRHQLMFAVSLSLCQKNSGAQIALSTGKVIATSAKIYLKIMELQMKLSALQWLNLVGRLMKAQIMTKEKTKIMKRKEVMGMKKVTAMRQAMVMKQVTVMKDTKTKAVSMTKRKRKNAMPKKRIVRNKKKMKRIAIPRNMIVKMVNTGNMEKSVILMIQNA